MSLQNRVDPFGALVSTSARGTLMGNRGGRFHEQDQNLGTRRWASRAWITCRCEYKGRQRKIWRQGYTELFFLDEVTAFAAGHRPCFLCRRAEAIAFQTCWPRPQNSAAEMDAVLHGERLNGKAKRLHPFPIDRLPNGVMIAIGNQAFAIADNLLLLWDFAGYIKTVARPCGEEVLSLTPPSTIAVLQAGYRPRFHKSAENWQISPHGLAIQSELD